jgi:hydrogenase maturation protease
MQTECLVRVSENTPTLKVSAGFLQPLAREIGKAEGRSPFQVVPELRVDGQLFQTWLEAFERKVESASIAMDASPIEADFPFSFPESEHIELLCEKNGRVAGKLRRRQEAMDGVMKIGINRVKAGLFKVTVRIINQTAMKPQELNDQNAVLMRTFASTHAVLEIGNGEFVSMTDPPPECQAAAEGCENIGTWPVLVGDEECGERHTLLSSPIILPDYPQIAPESSGDLFDGTEIDEILTLRIQTMTDEEKMEMRMVDEHARRVLERTENTTGQDLLKLHGTLRDISSFDDLIFGSSKRLEKISFGETHLQPGDKVRISPKGRADVMDMALAGKTGIIEALEEDAEGRVQLALVLEDDPGADMGMLRQPGHRFFYGLDEVELLQETT